MILSEKALRKSIQKTLRRDLVKESYDSLEDLRGAEENAEEALEMAIEEATGEVTGGAFSEALSEFFNAMGFVDPCDLVRKDPKRARSDAEALEQALEELKVSQAENINQRLGGFANVVGAAGVGSITYFMFNNKMNLADASGSQILDLFRNTDNDERNRNLMQQAQQSLPQDQQKDDTSYAQDAALARIQSMDDAIEAGMMPKTRTVNDGDVEAAAGGGDAGAAAARIVNRWSSEGFDKSGKFPDGKRYVPFQLFLKDPGGIFSTRKFVVDEKDITPKERGEMRRAGMDHTRKSLARAGGIDGKSKLVWDVDQVNIADHPDYKDMAAVFSAGQSGLDALKAAMLKKSEAFIDLGYKDPRAYWDNMMNNFTEAAAVTQSSDRGFWENATAELRGERPTEWQKYYDPKGDTFQRYSNPLNAFRDENEVPRNANPCPDGQRPGKGGECVPAIEWNERGFLTAGKYLVVGAAVLHVYKTLLSMAPGPVCSIKKFLGKVMGGIASAVRAIVGPIVDAIMGAVKAVGNVIGSIFESSRSFNAQKFDRAVTQITRLNETLSRFEEIEMSKWSQRQFNDKLRQKILENKLRKSVKTHLRFESTKAAWIKKYEKNRKAHLMSIKRYMISENQQLALAQQLASQQAIAAAQKEVDPFQDAFDLFVAMKGSGTNEADVERVIRKRLEDLDKLYVEYGELMKLMRSKKQSFQSNLESDAANQAALMGGAAYGIYALTPDDTKKKIAKTIKQKATSVGDSIMKALGGSVDEKTIEGDLPMNPQDLANQDPGGYMSSMPQEVQDAVNQSIEPEDVEKAEEELEIETEMDGGPLAFPSDPNADPVPLSSFNPSVGDEGEIEMPNDGGKYKYKAVQPPNSSKVMLVIDGPSGRFMASPEVALKNLTESKLIFEMGELGNMAKNLAKQMGGKEAAKHITYAGASAMAAKYATAAAMTWWDGVGLDQDLIEWLESDGMDDEADLVKKAIEKAGMNVKSSGTYDRGY